MKVIVQQKFIVCVLVVFLISLPLNQKIFAQEEAFASVPNNQRTRLVERLQLLVEYQRNRSGQITTICSLADRITKEDYVKEQQRLDAEKLSDVLLSFKPESVTYATRGPFDVLIRGCAKFQEGTRTVDLRSIVEAYREKGDWYFIRISPEVAVDGDAQPCSANINRTTKKF